jgi:simple sugar transport system permease protein
MSTWVRHALASIFPVVLSLVTCFVILGILRSDFPGAGEGYLQMLWGGIGDIPKVARGGGWSWLTRPWGESASKASLLMLTGLSVSVAFSVGLFNIGAQGQMIVGAIATTALGLIPLPRALHPGLCLLAGAIAGAVYALIPAVLKLRRGAHEVISTIMLNWVAVSLVENWLVVGPLRATTAGGHSRSGTNDIFASAQLPRLLGEISRLNAGFPFALATAFLIWAWLARTCHGFETRAVGLGAEAAVAAGIPLRRRIYQAMSLSGALAGLAGAIWILGTEYKYPATLTSPYGFDGIAMALIGQNHPLGVCAAALFFGTLRAGGTRMQLLGIHKSFPELIQGLALLFVAARLAWEKLLLHRRTPKLSSREASHA